MKTIPVKEENFLSQIQYLAHMFGWRVAHFRPARTKYGWRTAIAGDGAGFPDICMVKGKRIIFAELKSETGKVHPNQQQWLDALSTTGKVEVYLWRPSQFDDIVEVLREE